MIILYTFLLVFLLIYSYFLVDPNFTLVNFSFWTVFRNWVVYFGYYQRFWSFVIYITVILGLLAFFIYFLKNIKKINPFKIALLIAFLLLFSYPFLSHDFFNYLFDAKIATFYFKNPYFYKAMDFPTDPWLRFMHWTHRTYPYGPFFLLITLIPSFFSFGKFFLSFFFFKVIWIVFYLLGVYFLNKQNKRWAVIFATHPLIIIEGLVNGHNDIIGASLAVVGIYYLSKNKNIWGRIMLVLSLGIKYISFPLLFLAKKNRKNINNFILLSLVAIIIALTYFSEIQPWYFLVFFSLLPYFEDLILRLNIFFMGLLISYYPYIRLGGWDSLDKIQLKHIIILVSLVINVVYLFFVKKYEKSI